MNWSAAPAPAVLFVFSRPDHTRRTLEALAANDMAGQTDLIVYSDAARSEAEEELVEATREVVRHASGFRSLTVVERDQNYGLAKNIIDGVTSVCNKYGRAIVLEDDIVTSPQFLKFMNAALDKYKDEPRVWHISGWNYPIDTSGLSSTFFWRVMNCWGWATWADRWSYFSKDSHHLVTNWSQPQVEQFNLDGAENFWGQVISNHAGRIDTWAVFWYATIFSHGGLCLNPAGSLVRNIGHDGTGEHCGKSRRFDAVELAGMPRDWPDRCSEHKEAVRRIKNFYLQSRPSAARRGAGKLKRKILAILGH